MPIATKSDKIDLSSEKKTEELASKLVKKLRPGDTVFFYGEIGVGKTTLIRYLINGLQKENRLKISEVPSPTFNLMNEYQIKQIKINHYDLYRLKSSDEVKNMDLFNENSSTITLIEWPQIITEKPNNLIELTLNYENDHQKRSVQIKGLSL